MDPRSVSPASLTTKALNYRNYSVSIVDTDIIFDEGNAYYTPSVGKVNS